MHCSFFILEILKGGVKFDRNHYLCNLETIKWTDILNMKSLPTIIYNVTGLVKNCTSLKILFMHAYSILIGINKLYVLNKNVLLYLQGNEKCDPSCFNGSCWGIGPDKCQRSKYFYAFLIFSLQFLCISTQKQSKPTI